MAILIYWKLNLIIVANSWKEPINNISGHEANEEIQKVLLRNLKKKMIDFVGSYNGNTVNSWYTEVTVQDQNFGI